MELAGTTVKVLGTRQAGHLQLLLDQKKLIQGQTSYQGEGQSLVTSKMIRVIPIWISAVILFIFPNPDKREIKRPAPGLALKNPSEK